VGIISTFAKYTFIFFTFGFKFFNENQQASLKDPFYIPVGPITRARSKMIKEALSESIQEIWAGSKTGHSKFRPKEDEGVINLLRNGRD
jgi:hypothetical protein